MGKLLGSRTISALQATHIFRNVPRASLEHLLPHMEKISFPKNALAVSSEVRDDTPIYFVVSGVVRFCYCNQDGDELPLGARVISKNEIFGHDALAAGGNVRCRAVCESKTVCLAITPHSLATMLQQQDVAGLSMSHSIQTIINNREDVPVAAVEGAGPVTAFADGCLASLPASHQTGYTHKAS